jgi:hypothetical protein
MVCSAYYYIARQTVLSRSRCQESLQASTAFQNSFALKLSCVQFMTFKRDSIKLEQIKLNRA